MNNKTNVALCKTIADFELDILSAKFDLAILSAKKATRAMNEILEQLEKANADLREGEEKANAGR